MEAKGGKDGGRRKIPWRRRGKGKEESFLGPLILAQPASAVGGREARLDLFFFLTKGGKDDFSRRRFYGFDSNIVLSSSLPPPARGGKPS